MLEKTKCKINLMAILIYIDDLVFLATISIRVADRKLLLERASAEEVH